MMMRLYQTIHTADHEGSNASAPRAHLIRIYPQRCPTILMEQPLNALVVRCMVCQPEVIKMVFEMVDDLKTRKPTKEQIENYRQRILLIRKVIPGYGHAVLRNPIPVYALR